MEEDTDIKSVFEQAAKLVEDLPENLQSKAFELAVAEISSKNPISTTSLAVEVLNGSNLNDFFQKLQKETSIEVDRLKNVYKINKNGEIKIIFPLTGKSAQKQRILAYLYLFASRIGKDQEWVSALDFANCVDDYGVNDGHISKNLKIDSEYIRQGGTKRGKEYSLTPNGLQKAKSTLEEVC